MIFPTSSATSRIFFPGRGLVSLKGIGVGDLVGLTYFVGVGTLTEVGPAAAPPMVGLWRGKVGVGCQVPVGTLLKFVEVGWVIWGEKKLLLLLLCCFIIILSEGKVRRIWEFN